MKTISFTLARANFADTIETVLNDHLPVRISNKRKGTVVMMPESDFDAWQETIYLLKSPQNAQRLLLSIQHLESRDNVIIKTQEELDALAKGVQ